MSVEKRTNGRRSYGTGSLIVRTDAAGREVWYGKWRTNGRQAMRKIGPKRGDGIRDGLTRRQAEAEYGDSSPTSASHRPPASCSTCRR